jgi:hypothetical protein
MKLKDELGILFKIILRTFLGFFVLGSCLIIFSLIQYVFKDDGSTGQFDEGRLKLLLWIIPMIPFIVIAYLINKKISDKEEQLVKKDLFES